MARYRPQPRGRTPWRTNDLLGKTFLDKYSQPILRIGRDVWTRQQVVDDLHCGNFVAAHNLTHVAEKLGVESLDQLIARYTLEDLFQEKGVGLTTIYVFLCAQEAKAKDPLAWVDRPPDQIVTLGTAQRRARKHQLEQRKAQRAEARRARQAARTTSPQETTNGT